jgi:ABC-type Fe3+/spermidine/putrescine transport system ATPase subunit
VPHGRATALSPGEAVLISLRPENVVLDGQLSGPGASLRGQVIEVVYLGPSTQYTIECAHGLRLIATEPNGHANREKPRAVGADITVSWSAESSVVLPASSTKETA